MKTVAPCNVVTSPRITNKRFANLGDSFYLRFTFKPYYFYLICPIYFQ